MSWWRKGSDNPDEKAAPSPADDGPRLRYDATAAELERTTNRYNDLRAQYDKVVEENGNLKNERNALSRDLQKSQRLRENGNAPGKSPIAAEFPKTLAKVKGVLPITVVDVGAQLLESEDHAYAPLERAQACRKVAFEPIEEEAKKLAKAEPHTVVLPHFVGKGGPATFGLARFSPTSSLLEPNIAFLRKFMALPDMCERVARSEVVTTRLDDIKEIGECDFLKLDVQGGERDVLIGAERTLEDTIVVQTEVEFAPIYEGQGLFADIDSFLRKRNFELIDLIKLGYGGYAALPARTTESRLLWADAVYFKSPERLAEKGSAQLLKAAFIAHVNYGYYDLAADYIRHYDEQTGEETLAVYCRSV